MQLTLLALVAVAAAQNYSFPQGFDINKVEMGTRYSWCTAERNSCPKICGGVADENFCEPDSLEFSCKCDNGTAANVEPYMQTVPYFVCQANFGQCIDSHPNDADGQQKCKDENKCGTLNASEASSGDSSSSSSSSASPSKTADLTSSSMPSSVDAAATSNSPSSTANAAGMLQEHSTGVLATALFVAMQMVL